LSRIGEIDRRGLWHEARSSESRALIFFDEISSMFVQSVID